MSKESRKINPYVVLRFLLSGTMERFKCHHFDDVGDNVSVPHVPHVMSQLELDLDRVFTFVEF